MKEIYYQGKSFGEAGMINICLSVEILLKSINASMTSLEDEIEIHGTTVYPGRDEVLKVLPIVKAMPLCNPPICHSTYL